VGARDSRQAFVSAAHQTVPPPHRERDYHGVHAPSQETIDERWHWLFVLLLLFVVYIYFFVVCFEGCPQVWSAALEALEKFEFALQVADL